MQEVDDDPFFRNVHHAIGDKAEQAFNDVIRAWKQKKPIFRECARFREEAAALWEAPDVSWFSELVDDRDLISRMPQVPGRGGPEVQSIFMAWVATKMRSVSGNSNWFRLSEGLTYKLLLTDLKGALVGDLQLPMTAFYIELPPGIFYLNDKQTKMHEVRSLTVARGQITERTLDLARKAGDETTGSVHIGPRLLIEAYGEPNENSANPFDDTWIFKSYPIGQTEAEIDAVIRDSANDKERSYERNLNHGRICDRPVDGLEIREILLRFVLNLCIYMGSEKSSVIDANEPEIQRLHGGKKFKNLRKPVQAKIQELRRDRVFLVGSDVTITPEMRDIARTEGTGSQSLRWRTLVRGHWRNQAYGPAHSLRQRKWIEPHVRGNELPTQVVGHNYNVK